MDQPTAALTLQETLIYTTNQVFGSLIVFIPKLIIAIGVFLVGWLLGGWIKTLVKGGLHAINVTALTKNTSLEKFLKKAEVRMRIEEIIGEVFRWIIIYIFLIASVNVIGLTTVSAFLTNLLSYIPQIISASIILALGILAAGLVESVVKSAVGGFDLATGRLIGKIASYTVVVFATLAAIGELGIAQQYINILLIGFVAMMSLGLGLAFGLGAKDVISDILRNWYKNFNQDIKPKK